MSHIASGGRFSGTHVLEGARRVEHPVMLVVEAAHLAVAVKGLDLIGNRVVSIEVLWHPRSLNIKFLSQSSWIVGKRKRKHVEHVAGLDLAERGAGSEAALPALEPDCLGRINPALHLKNKPPLSVSARQRTPDAAGAISFDFSR